jgi:hypothetical protein
MNDTARTICDWILESPMVAEVCENRLREVAAGIQRTAVDQLGRGTVCGAFMCGAIEDGAGGSRAVGAGGANSARGNCRLTRRAKRSPTLPVSVVPVSTATIVCVVDDALASVCLRRGAERVHRSAAARRRAGFVHDAQERCVISGRCPLTIVFAPTSVARNYFVPKEATAAMLLFGIRRDARALFARAHAIVQSVARHAPKHDLPTFDNVDLQMLTRIRSSEPGLQTGCASWRARLRLAPYDGTSACDVGDRINQRAGDRLVQLDRHWRRDCARARSARTRASGCDRWHVGRRARGEAHASRAGGEDGVDSVRGVAPSERACPPSVCDARCVLCVPGASETRMAILGN